MKQVKKIFNGGLMGIGIGYTITLCLSFIYGTYSPGVSSFLNQYDSVLTAVTIQTIIYTLLGIIQAYASEIMKSQTRSLLLNTLIHFAVIVIPLLAAGYFLHWQRDLSGLLSIGLIASIIYGGIWLSQYLYMRSQIKKINKKLAKKL